MKKEEIQPLVPAFGRRKLMKFGAAAAVGTLISGNASAAVVEQSKADGEKSAGATIDKATDASSSAPTIVTTQSGWKNESGRAHGNGPMDDTSRQLVSFVNSFSASNLGDFHVVSNTMIDSIACLLAGADSEAGKIGARIGRKNQSDLKSTIVGYNVTTSPEAAAFANASMVRNTDFNDGDPEHGGGHSSVIIPGILAVGEGLHSTGTQVLTAVALGYEILSAMGNASRGKAKGWDSPYEGLATALATGKLLGLNEDQLANALSIALIPHMPLFVSHVGALSMWKGCHSAIGVRNGVYAALLAQEGMTGPAQPFEERGGLFDMVTGPLQLRLPINPDGRLAMEAYRTKRYPAEGNSQGLLQQTIPAIREWTKVEDIESITIEMAFGSWQEIGDPPKWDPRNRETADHSMAYLVAVALTDGEVYLNSFANERYIKDAAIRQLMEKITCQLNPEFKDEHRNRTTVRTKNGGKLVKDVFKEENPMTHDDIVAKFKRVCGFISMPKEQTNRALAAWSNLQHVHDVAVPMRDLAHFGKPWPL